MSEALLAKDIESFLSNHRGMENAVPRRELLAYLRSQAHSLPRNDEVADRKVRRIYAEMPQVGHCARGIFWIVTPADRKATERDLHSRAMSELVRERRVKDAGVEGQRGLFE